jgi:hypothetical protein
MKYKIFNKLLMIVAFVCFSIISIAQNFEWKASILGISSNGFQKLQLAPQVVSKLNQDFGDIRIIDNSGKEVPYIFDQEQPFIEKDHFIEYKIIEKKEQTSWPYYTRIVIHNPSKNEISNINLIIKNSDVNKKLKLSGSDDNRNWYIIKDNYRFQAMYSDMETSVIKIIDFPLSNYEYYEILIDDWKDNPINVLKSGFFNTSVEKGKYSTIDKPEISQYEQKDEKESLIKLNFNEPQLLQKLNLKIDGPEFYYRNASIQVRDSIVGKRNRFEPYFKTVADIIISSNTSNTFYFEKLWAKELYIRIKNHDDQPLRVSDITCSQLNHYLICKLESSKKYDVFFGNPKISVPVYDIQHFSDKIPDIIPVLTTGKLESIGKAKTETSSGIHLDKKMIWIVIGLVVIMLIYMVLKMLKEMRSHKNE